MLTYLLDLKQHVQYWSCHIFRKIYGLKTSLLTFWGQVKTYPRHQ